MTSNILQSQLWHIYMLKPVKFGDSFLFILKCFVGKAFFQGKCTAECVTSARYYMHIQLTLAHQNNCINHSKKPQNSFIKAFSNPKGSITKQKKTLFIV